MTEDGYATWAAIAQARQDRFLARVFSDAEGSGWLLKGGGAMLARVADCRATRDVDLAVAIGDLDAAQAALERAVRRQLDDHLRFDLVSARATGRGENQRGVQTRRLLFACVDALTGRKVGEVPVDLVVGPTPVGSVETVTPATRLVLPRGLTAPQYRLFPVADHIAEKVCATLQQYDGRPSSRVKDLIDLVTIARTQRISLRELRAAIEHKRRQTDLGPIAEFIVPGGWGRQYRALAAATPSVGTTTRVGDAERLVRLLVDPALRGIDSGAGDEETWQPGVGWTTTGPPTP